MSDIQLILPTTAPMIIQATAPTDGPDQTLAHLVENYHSPKTSSRDKNKIK